MYSGLVNWQKKAVVVSICFQVLCFFDMCIYCEYVTMLGPKSVHLLNAMRFIFCG